MANEMESYPTTRAMKYKLDDLKQEGETYKDVVDRLLEMAAKPDTTRATAPLPKDEYDPADHVDATIKLSKAQKHALILDEPGDSYKESLRYLLAMAEESDSGLPSPLQEPPFTDYPKAWYEPDTNNPDEIVAVRVPDDEWGSTKHLYFETYERAAKAIRRWSHHYATAEEIPGLAPPLQEPPFTDHPDAWYEPDTDNPDELVAVRVPDDAWGNATRTYFKTYEGAAKAITRWYDRLY